MKLYEHQKNILAENKAYAGIFLGTGGGKTRIALELAEGRTLVVCPKQQREDRTWQENAKKFGIKVDLVVISKEDFRRDWRKLETFDTFIIDECHNNLGVLPEVRQKRVSKSRKPLNSLRPRCHLCGHIHPKGSTRVVRPQLVSR